MNRRGVSPLIATVLLIAFAVSMGAVIMNLGANLGGKCSSTDVEIFAVDNKPLVCFNSELKQLQLTLNNKGDPIDGFKITITGDAADAKDVIGPLGELEKSVQTIEISGTNVKTVSVAPLMKESGKFRICKEQARNYVSIPSC